MSYSLAAKKGEIQLVGTWQQLGARLALEPASTNDLDLKVSPFVAQAQLDVPQDRGAEHLAAYQLARAKACEHHFQTFSFHSFASDKCIS